jgi:hypothetical protein
MASAPYEVESAVNRRSCGPTCLWKPCGKPADGSVPATRHPSTGDTPLRASPTGSRGSLRGPGRTPDSPPGGARREHPDVDRSDEFGVVTQVPDGGTQVPRLPTELLANSRDRRRDDQPPVTQALDRTRTGETGSDQLRPVLANRLERIRSGETESEANPVQGLTDGPNRAAIGRERFDRHVRTLLPSHDGHAVDDSHHPVGDDSGWCTSG